MLKYEQIEKFYRLHLWDKNKVKMAVDRGYITEDQYFTITGERLNTEESI